ncbi:UBC-like protein [Punctularia strigosozonata HHB-11173 SS5]|uniref:UBC-like protein n=1 Tax=Punctularia strigosozonata (strain HHB-11173) TaxID=741275 RepID=UPI000441803F|nr:UBC-like protein [Punctularia strigosozonata HHB-11173 SS5]EIN09465.1 UBC-like protein [Punctularia strigosozonata HHB-11173 SS5]
MASKAAHKRLSKEYVAMQKEPPPFVWAAPEEKNILNWHYIIRGPPDSPFAGGEYHGMLMFPSEYPFKPPGIKMLTPSGRFQPDKKICFSMSDFHPGTWNPAWSVATILTGLLSFMLSDDITTGSVSSSDNDKRILAGRSHAWNLTQKRFKEQFPDFCTPTAKDLPNMGQQAAKSDSKSDDTPSTDVKSVQTPPSAPSLQAGDQSTVSSSLKGRVTEAHARAAAMNVRQPAAGASSDRRTDAAPKAVAAHGWAQVVWERWRWALFLFFALVVSRLSSAP